MPPYRTWRGYDSVIIIYVIAYRNYDLLTSLILWLDYDLTGFLAYVAYSCMMKIILMLYTNFVEITNKFGLNWFRSNVVYFNNSYQVVLQ